MQASHAEPILFCLRAAMSLRVINLVLHAIVAAVLLFEVAMQRQPLMLWWLLLLAPLLLSGWWLDRQLALRGSGAIRFLRYDAEGWSAGPDESTLHPILLRSDTTVNAAFVVLCWRDVRQHRRQLLITPAMLEPVAYRRLCRLLWQADANAPTSIT